MAKDYAKQPPRRRSKNQRSRGYSKKKQANQSKLYVFTGILLVLFIGGLMYLNKHKPTPSPAVVPTKNTEVAAPASSSISHHASHHKLKKVAKNNSNSSNSKEPQPPQFDFYTILPKMKVWVPKNQTGQATQTNKPPIIPTINGPVATNTLNNQDTETAKKTNDKKTNDNVSSATEMAKKDLALEQNSQQDDMTAGVPTTSKKDVKLPTPLESMSNNDSDSATDSAASTTSKSTQANSHQHYLLQIASQKNSGDTDRLKAQLTLLGFDVVVKPAQSKDKTVNRIWVGPFNTLAAATKAQLDLTAAHIKSTLVE